MGSALIVARYEPHIFSAFFELSYGFVRFRLNNIRNADKTDGFPIKRNTYLRHGFFGQTRNINSVILKEFSVSAEQLFPADFAAYSESVMILKEIDLLGYKLGQNGFCI